MRVLLGFAVVLLLALLGTAAAAEVMRITNGTLLAAGEAHPVTLPNVLDDSTFDPDGSIVTYRLTFDLPHASKGLQGIYISKLSLSGRIKHDGRLIWSCGGNDLPELRCLHRPHLVQLPEGFLHAGRNIIDIEVFADGRQTNGLSQVLVGPYDQLLYGFYLPMRFIKIDLVRALATIAAVAGFLSLAAGFAVPRERIFFVFGVTAILEAAASFVILAVDPIGSKEFASWLVFTVRFVGIPLKLLTFYEAFGKMKLSDPTVAFFIVVIFVGTTLIALSGSDRRVVMILYLVILLGIVFTVVRMTVWTIAEPNRRHLIWLSTAVLILAAGLHDYGRLGGAASFDGVYLLYYVFPSVIIIMVTMLFTQMGLGLRIAQDFTVQLKQQVAERTAELESALAATRALENSALRLTATIPFGTFILRTRDKVEDRFVFFSERLRQMTGLSGDDGPPSMQQVVAHFHPDDADLFCTGLRSALASGLQFEAEARMRGANGDWRWLHFVILPQLGSPHSEVWDGAVIDVTDARQAEERMRVANANLVEAAARKSRIEERERLLQDMHDGFGSQLSSARLAIEQGQLQPAEISRILFECSEDLRIMVDTLGNQDGRLADAVADFRYRIDRRLQGTGIAMQWDISIDEEAHLPPATVLQVVRVLQEATTNALRHSGAETIEVAIRTEADRLSVRVRDNGTGLQGASSGGRGISNMKKRSREIGGRLSVDDADGGTTVLLELTLSDES